MSPSLNNNYYEIRLTQFTTTVFLYSEHHHEEGRNAGRNMLVRNLWIKWIVNTEVYLGGYLYILGSDW